MENLGLILLATGLISLGGLIGIVSLAVNQKRLERALLVLVSLSAGALMGGDFLHLLPEAVNQLDSELAFGGVLVVFIGFFLVEKVLHWHHCHKGNCEQKELLGRINLIGDSLHNFLDGLIIAAGFGVSRNLGWATTLAVALHEIPQEIGDFGVLLYAGWGRRKALVANFLAALTVVLGGAIGYLISVSDNLIAYMLPVAAGGFIYIAASDLMPEIKKEESLRKSVKLFLVFLLGVGLMWALKLLEP